MPRLPLSMLVARACLAVLPGLLPCGGMLYAGQTENDAVAFNRDIRPLLSDRCYKCHGPDEQQRQAGLRLDTLEGATARLESGVTAVVPGHPEQSELIRRITAPDKAERMPPPDSGKQLSPQEIDLLRRWVAQGAPWQGHWAFIAPERPPLPEVRNSVQVFNPIDRFVLARLEKEGLSLQPEADRVTLIRRVTLDLTGLPPTPAEVDAFLADPSPDAYVHLVDRLLQSPRYGEHMARYWLDLARYGDTHGLHLDNERALWKYREWVIDAFNRNLPYDRFAIEQLAGDLLPDATVQQRVATGFNRCNVTTSEGGSINEEVLVRYAVDRTETLGTVFLGLTLGCAVCHDHKFDPISQREFYQLYAFYNAAADPAMDGNQLAPPPILRLPTPEQESQLAKIDRQLAAVQQKIRDELARIQYVDPAESGSEESQSAVAQRSDYVWIDDAVPSGAQLQGNSPWEWVQAPDHPVHSGKKSMRRQAQGLSQHFFTGAKPGLKIGEGDVLFAYVYLDPQDPPQTVMLQFNDGTWEHRAYWGEDRIPFGAGGGPNHLHRGELPEPGRWVRLEVKAADVGLSPGAELNGWAFTQFGGTVYWDRAGSVTATPQDKQSFDSLARWAATARAAPPPGLPPAVAAALKVEPAKRNAEQQKQLREYFLQHVYPATRDTFVPLHAEVQRLEKERKELDAAIPVTMVMADLPQPRETFVLIRGQYNKRGEKVQPGVPAIFPPLPEGAPANRLGLAQWLVRPDHPLTARVAVNRFWQQLFGTGIVKTSEDFGSQGAWPTHPDLLDWLAVEFQESGWDIKRLMKLLVTSATYRQSSDAPPHLWQRDPENLLLARGPRFRLDAEVVRDAALYVSGLLVEQLGGRSVRIYQPPGIWEAVGFVGSNTREYRRDSGQALYRRSMYTFWKRTAPHPSMLVFDAPSRETCVARRARTNTPLQALALMNDEQYVEAARHLAARMFREGGAAPAEQVAYGFRLATSRQPEPAEVAVLLRVYQQQHQRYQQHPDAAAQLLSVGESKLPADMDQSRLAALTLVANMLLNLDETITKQ
jgi:hypothetical protein